MFVNSISSFSTKKKKITVNWIWCNFFICFTCIKNSTRFGKKLMVKNEIYDIIYQEFHVHYKYILFELLMGK